MEQPFLSVDESIWVEQIRQRAENAETRIIELTACVDSLRTQMCELQEAKNTAEIRANITSGAMVQIQEDRDNWKKEVLSWRQSFGTSIANAYLDLQNREEELLELKEDRDKFETERDKLLHVLVTLRRWLGEHTGDKYTGQWWQGEINRLITLGEANADKLCEDRDRLTTEVVTLCDSLERRDIELREALDQIARERSETRALVHRHVEERSALERDKARLAAEVLRYEEREAAVCPEDFGFEEVIAGLNKRAAKAEAEVARLKEQILDHDCPSFSMCPKHIGSRELEECPYCTIEWLTARWERLNVKLRGERLASLDRPVEGYTDGLDNALYMMAALEREEQYEHHKVRADTAQKWFKPIIAPASDGLMDPPDDLECEEAK